jgi:hypothetical protein
MHAFHEISDKNAESLNGGFLNTSFTQTTTGGTGGGLAGVGGAAGTNVQNVGNTGIALIGIGYKG